MKKVLFASLLATTVAISMFAQDAAPAQDGAAAPAPAREGGFRGNRPGAEGRWNRGPAGDTARPRMTAADRVINSNDTEGGMVLRFLTNPRFGQQFGITDEQRTALTASMTTYDEQIDALRPALEAALKAQTDALNQENPDEGQVMVAVDAVWKLRTDIAKIQTRKLMAVQKQLTPEQSTRLRTMMTQMRQRPGMGGMGGEGQRPGMGGEGRRPGMGGEGRRPGMGGEGNRRPRGDAEGGNRRGPRDQGAPAQEAPGKANLD